LKLCIKEALTSKFMKKANGKSNIGIVRDYYTGTRPFIQVGYDANTAILDKKEGEEWEDADGKRWIKKSGYKQRVGKQAVRLIEKKCEICNADMKWGNHLDKVIYPKTGRCYECNIEFEAIMRSKGHYAAYEKYKVVNNELAMLRDFKAKVVDSINYLEKYTPQTKDPQFFNEDGSSEIWLDDTDRREKVLSDLHNDLVAVTEKIDVAVKELISVEYDSKIEKSIKKLTVKKIKEIEKNG
jgi:hypothetical protein